MYGDPEEEHSRLLETLAGACRELPISPAEVQAALAPQDMADWRRVPVSNEMLAAFAASLMQRREIAQGVHPAAFTARATCKQCGPRFLNGRCGELVLHRSETRKIGHLRSFARPTAGVNHT